MRASRQIKIKSKIAAIASTWHHGQLAPLYLALLNKEDSIQSFYGLKSIYFMVLSLSPSSVTASLGWLYVGVGTSPRLLALIIAQCSVQSDHDQHGHFCKQDRISAAKNVGSKICSNNCIPCFNTVPCPVFFLHSSSSTSMHAKHWI